MQKLLCWLVCFTFPNLHSPGLATKLAGLAGTIFSNFTYQNKMVKNLSLRQKYAPVYLPHLHCKFRFPRLIYFLDVIKRSSLSENMSL